MRASGLSRMAVRTEEPAISWLMKISLENPGLISLAAGFTDNASLPVLATERLSDKILDSPSEGPVALQYGATAGDPRLRQLTAQRLAQLDGLGKKAASSWAGKTLITHGSQQLLYLVTECLCDEGDIVLIEDPTYFVYLGILQSRGLQGRTVPLEKDGLDLHALESLLETLRSQKKIARVKFLYLVSYYQNPTGRTTSLEKKKKALALLRKFEKAAGHPIYLVEDAAYRELRFEGDDVPSALTVDPSHQRVIYAGTYSKPFATGVRVGFGILPEPLFTSVLRIKGNHDFGTANFLQKILAEALQGEAFDRQVKVLQKRYRTKAQSMVSAIRKYFPKEVAWDVPKGGLYVWATLPGNISTGPQSKFFRAVRDAGVLYVPGSLCYGNDRSRPHPDSSMRLSFGGAQDQEIPEGIRRIGECLRKAM